MDGKPLGIAIEELTNTLIHEINASCIPAYIVDFILLKIELQVSEASRKQIAEERDQYNSPEITAE